MADLDIVTRLNQAWSASLDKDARFVIVHKNEWVRCTDLTREAADEIKRLRAILQGWEHSARNAQRDIATLRDERDQARREVCELRTDIGFSRPITPYLLEFAASRGWDCFKENTND